MPDIVAHDGQHPSLSVETPFSKSNHQPPSRRVRVLFEDHELIVFNKPSGVLVIPAPGKTKRSMVEIVNAEFPDPESRRLYPCHRLDQETSGVILFAKGKRNQQLLMAEFQKQTVQKTYVAFVRGRPQRMSGELRDQVRDFHERKYHPRASPRAAVSRYWVRQVKKNFSVVEIQPKTGRTNQIRIQFKNIGCPLLGERLYARGKDFPLTFRRLALHAQELAFRHPVTKKEIRVTSDLPWDMREFLARNP